MFEQLRMRRLWVETVRKSDLPARQKLAFRVLLVTNPEVQEALNDFLAEKANLPSAQGLTTLADGSIIELIIKYLPEIIELITLLIGLFG